MFAARHLMGIIGSKRPSKNYYIFFSAVSAFIVMGGTYVLKYKDISTGRSQYSLYYRLEINLSDKQGRSVGINIVVGCDAHRSHSFGGSSSSDVMGMDAARYAWSIPDGHALSVRTSKSVSANDTCAGGTTDNGRVPKNWLPFVIWYDNATDLSHGLAYATQDAYFSPKSKLVFHSARITRATADEYFASKASNPANLLPTYLSDALLDSARPQRMTHRSDVTPAMLADPKLAWRNSDWLTCRGVLRVPLPPSVRAELTKLRPKDANKYWHLNGKLPEHLRYQIEKEDVLYGGSFWWPDAMQQSKDRPKVYPTFYDGNLDRLTEGTFSDGSYHKESMIVQDYLGFMDCGRKALAPIEAGVTKRKVESWNISQDTCFINGILIGEYKRCRDYIPIAYEETDYAIFESQEIRG